MTNSGLQPGGSKWSKLLYHPVNRQLCHTEWCEDNHHSIFGLWLFLCQMFAVKSFIRIIMRKLNHWICFFENYEALHLPEKLLLYKEVCNKIDIVLYHTRNTTNTWLEHQTDKIWEKFTVTIQLTKSRSSLWWQTSWIWYYCYVTDLGPFSCVWPVLMSPITLFSWC